MSATCAIVILNFNGRALLDTCLPTVVEAARSAGGKHEVVVLDNGSTDGSLDWLKQNWSQVTRQTASANRFLVSYNEFLAGTRHPLVFLLNNDVRLDAHCLPPLLRHFDDPSVFAVAPLVLNEPGRRVETGRTYLRFSQGRFRYRQADVQPGLTATASTSAGMFDCRKLLAFGGFDDLLLPMYGEEMDLTLSAYRRGWVVRYEPASVAHHLGGASINKAASRHRRRSSLVKNRHLSMIKHVHSWPRLAVYLGWTLLLLPVRAITFDRPYFSGTWAACHQLGLALERRRREQNAAVISESAMFRRLGKLRHSPEAS